MFWGISPYSANCYLRGQTAFYNMLSFPYGFALPSNGSTYYGNFDPATNTPMEAFQKQLMLKSHFAYLPYIDVSSCSNRLGGINQEQVLLAANKDRLQIKYASLNTNLNNLIGAIDSALDSGDLSDGQRAELENKKAEAEKMLKELEDFAKNSPNMEVADALKDIEAMQGKYYDLRDEVGDLMNRIQAGEDIQPTLTPEQIAQEYENETKPAIEDLLQSPDVSDPDKEALKAKQEELEKAMQEGAPQEELNRINNELWDLINGIYDKLDNMNVQNDDDDDNDDDNPVKPTPTEDLTVDEIKEKLKKEMKPAISDLEDNENLDDEYKQALKDKQTELRDAIRDGASEEEIQKLYKELNDMINAAKFKIAVSELVHSPYLGSKDIDKIDKKLKELEDAIKAGATEEELQKIYDDLNDMISDAKDDINTAKAKEDKKNAENREKARTEYKEYMETYKNSKIIEGNDLYEYVPAYLRKNINELIEGLNKGIQENSLTAYQIETRLRHLKEYIKTAEEKAQKNHDEATRISDMIYVAAMNDEFKLRGTGDNEQKIKDCADKCLITKDNVIFVLKAWNDDHIQHTNPSGTNDVCILETINDVFSEHYNASKIQNRIIAYILATIVQYAQENGLADRVNGKINNVWGLFASGKKNEAYIEFRRLLQDVFNIPPKTGAAGSW